MSQSWTRCQPGHLTRPREGRRPASVKQMERPASTSAHPCVTANTIASAVILVRLVFRFGIEVVGRQPCHPHEPSVGDPGLFLL